MEQKLHFRHELKYRIGYPEYQAMKRRICHVMSLDPHTGPDGTYRIRSICFDNGNDKALREKGGWRQ